MPRRLAFLLLSVFALASCGKAVSVQYTMTFDSQETGRKLDLASASGRMIERRLMGLKQDPDRGDVSVQGDLLTVKVKDAKTAEILTEQITQPIDLHVMVEADDASADIRNEQYGAFKDTSLGGQHIDWVSAKASSQKGKAVVVINFNPQGKELLNTIFEQNRGKKMGIFVRGILMSQKLIDDKDTQSSIMVDGVPNLELALTFADDVNVGVHVDFAVAK